MNDSPKPKAPARATGRNFEIAHGIYVASDPEKMGREDLLEALYLVADYGSRTLVEKIVLSKTITNAMTNNEKRA